MVNEAFIFTTGKENLDDIENLSQTSSTVLKEATAYMDLSDIDNLIDLECKTDENVASFMKHRYTNKMFYTWAGQTLISVNPYEDTTSQIEDSSISPTLDDVVSRAWFKLAHNIGKKNQAIVISGESGSGKTFSSYLAIKSIAKLQINKNLNPSENILWQAWSSVPLLTAFGNAPNEHNSNSSRFGKLLQLQYENEQIVGAYTQTFLLEKSRVTGPNFQEGNFHIFQQILSSVNDETLESLYLDKNVPYKIAPKAANCLKSTYPDTVKSLKILNITELSEFLSILAVILNLGNVCFSFKEETCYVTTDSLTFLRNAAKLLKVETKTLNDILMMKTFSAKNHRSTTYTSPCNKDECIERRNCLMRFLYDKLFLWLVERINEQTYRKGYFKLIGILDVYGFEIFETNNFEQLCINYANERLQQYFVKDYIIKEQHDLISEGLYLEDIDTIEYAARLEVLDGPVSVFSILNEECVVKRFNTDIFVNIRLSENLSDSLYFENPRNNFSNEFIIKHFAGNVTYTTKMMLAKNRDKVPEEMISFLKNCRFPFLKCILQTNFYQEMSEKTLLTKFKKSLDNLMKTLNEADVQYIKCLKPNGFQISDFLDETYFVHQMRVNGIFDILKLHFQNFCIKLSYKEFSKKFSMRSLKLLEYKYQDDIHVGKKLIYLTKNGYSALETLKCLQQSTAVRKIQCWWKIYDRKLRAAKTIQNFYRSVLHKRKFLCLENFIDLSKKSCDFNIEQEYTKSGFNTQNYFNSCRKAEEYLKIHYLNRNYDGEPLSLTLEKVFNSVQTKPFRRVVFSGEHIITYNRLAEIPVRLHLSKTCIPYSNLLPRSELPKGLPDIFSP